MFCLAGPQTRHISMNTVCPRYRCSMLSIGTYLSHSIHVSSRRQPSSTSYSWLFGAVYWYVCELFCSRRFSSFTFVHFLFQISMFCPAGPQHLSYLNECGLPSLSPFGAAHRYVYKPFHRLIFSSLTFVFHPPDFDSSVTQYVFFCLFPFIILILFHCRIYVLLMSFRAPRSGLSASGLYTDVRLPSCTSSAQLLFYNMCTEPIQ